MSKDKPIGQFRDGLKNERNCSYAVVRVGGAPEDAVWKVNGARFLETRHQTQQLILAPTWHK